MHRFATSQVILLSAVFAAGCASSTPDVPSGPGGGTGAGSVRILSGGVGTDTVMVTQGDLLRVEVRDENGRLAAGQEVDFHTPAAPGETDPNSVRRVLYVCPATYSVCATMSATQSGWQFSAAVTTDANGIAQARVQHGIVAGTGVIEISVPSRLLSTTASFETRTGGAASFATTFRDSAIFVGSSAPLAVAAADRFGNPRTEAVTVETQAPGVATFSAGAVTGVALGRAAFALRSGTLSDVVRVSVVPRGRLAVYSLPVSGATPELWLVDTDGGARRRVATSAGVQTAGYLPYSNLIWQGDGRRLVVNEAGATGKLLLVAYDTATAARTVLVDTSAFTSAMDASFARVPGSLWFYGTRGPTTGVFKAPADGSATQYLLPGYSPAISPGGTRLAYIPAGTTVVRDLATGVETPIAPPGYTPVWSPAGDLIAIRQQVNGKVDLTVVRPDGTGARTISSDIYSGSTFSPDGEWIATIRPNVSIELVRVSDGLRLPIPGPRTYTEVAWRP